MKLRITSVLLFAVALLALTPGFGASIPNDHIVPGAELEQRLEDVEHDRQRNIEDLHRVLSAEPAEQAIESARIDPARVREAIPQLDDATLAELAQSARQIEEDVSGGIIGGLILLLLLAIVLIVLYVSYVK